jgi:hypothetical protein
MTGVSGLKDHPKAAGILAATAKWRNEIERGQSTFFLRKKGTVPLRKKRTVP